MSSVEPLPDIYQTASSEPAPQALSAADVEKNAPPPTYESLFGKVRRARKESKNKAKFSIEVLKIFCKTNGCVIGLSVFLAVPLSMLIMGAIFFHDCRADSFLPITFIVQGVVTIFSFILTIARVAYEKKKEKMPKNKNNTSNKKPNQGLQKCCTEFIDPITKVFIFGWFIRGVTVVYSLDWVSTPTTAEKYCDPVFYYFAFWIITAMFIALGSVIFIAVTFCCVTAIFCKKS